MNRQYPISMFKLSFVHTFTSLQSYVLCNRQCGWETLQIDTSPEQRASMVTNSNACCQRLTNHRKVSKTFQRPTKIVLKTCRGKLELNCLTVQPFKDKADYITVTQLKYSASSMVRILIDTYFHTPIHYMSRGVTYG